MFLKCSLPILVYMLPLAADPWGKDADLCRRPVKVAPPSCRTSWLGALGEGLIEFHQEIISPCDGPRSHFLPSSSQYTREAMRIYGFYQGFLMGCDRLMRENSDPWIYRTVIDAHGKKMKLNPIP